VRDRSKLIDFYRHYGAGTFAAEEPAYAEVCASLEDYPDLIDLLLQQPDEAQQPNLLFAAVHYLLLEQPGHPLFERYRQPATGEVAPTFARFVSQHRDQVAELLATRRTQTNEVGRSSVLSLMLADAAMRTSSPLAWVDLGASAGLNLAIEGFRIEFGDGSGGHRAIGPVDAGVQLSCDVRSGNPPIAQHHAAVEWRLGLDRSPIDISEPAEVRWLHACLWPSRVDRHQRLAAAVLEAQRAGIEVLQADVVDGFAKAYAAAPSHLPLVVTTTWVWYYLPQETRDRMRHLMANAGRPVLWYSLEGRGVVEDLGLELEDEAIESVMGRVVFGGDPAQPSTATLLGNAHAHGAWIEWFDEPAS
jgi:hypothetical protein